MSTLTAANKAKITEYLIGAVESLAIGDRISGIIKIIDMVRKIQEILGTLDWVKIKALIAALLQALKDGGIIDDDWIRTGSFTAAAVSDFNEGERDTITAQASAAALPIAEILALIQLILDFIRRWRDEA